MLLALPPANNDESMPSMPTDVESAQDYNIWMRALNNPTLFFTVQQEPSANIEFDEVDPPVNNKEALPISIDHPTLSETVEPITGQQTPTLLDFLIANNVKC